MELRERKPNMLIPTMILGTLASILVGIGYWHGSGQHLTGLRTAFQMLFQIMPLLVFALIVAGMIQVLIPNETIARWLGEESGWRGIMIGTVAGGLSPGGPFVSLPVAAGLFRAGSGVGTTVAYLTGWSLWAVTRVPMEVGILGWKLTFMRLASTFFFPPIAGFIAHLMFSGTK
jgi:uncharacterized membrane protein YraQ (UPF0718 family)